MNKSEILYERVWYLPTLLIDKVTGQISLFTRTYQIRRTPKGNIKLDGKIDVVNFDTDTELAHYIGKERAVELPPEADGNPKYLPPRLVRLAKKKELSHDE